MSNRRSQSGSQKVAVVTTAEPQRVQSLATKPGQTLSSLEESVVRMHHGISLRADAALRSNATDDTLRERLLNMEVDAFIASGRTEELPDVPGVAPADKTNALIDKLRS